MGEVKLTCLVLTAAALLAQASKEPQFGDYSVPTWRGVPAKPKLVTAGQRKFRTMIREWTERGPNFAGHFTIAQWGCGTGCIQFALVDNESGTVYDGPFGSLPNAYLCLDANPDQDDTGIFFQRDSSLIEFRGCPNEKQCNADYYQWTGDRFRLLRGTRIKQIFGCGP